MEFGAIQIVGGILMIISSILLIIITMMQEQKQQDMSSALSGQSDNFFGKGNVSSSRELLTNSAALMYNLLSKLIRSPICGI